MNPIQHVVQSRVDSLVSSAKGSAAASHSGTTGTLRERLLLDFFRDLVPRPLALTSGIACDAMGRTSRQCDLMVHNDSTLPAMVMMESVAVVPVDALHLVGEIKSTLRSEHLKEIADSRESLNALQLAALQGGSDVKVPAGVVLAFDNSVAPDTLQEWMKHTPDIVSVCVIGSLCLSKETAGITIYEPSEDKPRHWETLVFVSQLFKFLQESMASPRRPYWEAYIRGVRVVDGQPRIN